MIPLLRFGGGLLGLAHAPALGPTTAPRAIPSRSVAEADLAYLPSDAETVIGINFAPLRESALWQRFVAPQLAGVGGFRDMEALCGFDPLTSLGSISIGVKDLGEEARGISGAVVIHGFDKTKAMSCFSKQRLAEAEKNGAKFTIGDNLVLVDVADSNMHAAFTFVDDTTALIVLGPEAATKEGVVHVAAATGTLATSSTFATTLRNVNTDSAMWLMTSGRSKLLDDALADVPELADVKPGAFYLSLGVTDSLALDVGVGLGTPANVARVISHVEAKLKESFAKSLVSSYLDQLDVFADGADLIVSLAVSGDQIAQILTLVKANPDVVVEKN